MGGLDCSSSTASISFRTPAEKPYTRGRGSDRCRGRKATVYSQGYAKSWQVGLTAT